MTKSDKAGTGYYHIWHGLESGMLYAGHGLIGPVCARIGVPENKLYTAYGDAWTDLCKLVKLDRRRSRPPLEWLWRIVSVGDIIEGLKEEALNAISLTYAPTAPVESSIIKLQGILLNFEICHMYTNHDIGSWSGPHSVRPCPCMVCGFMVGKHSDSDTEEFCLKRLARILLARPLRIQHSSQQFGKNKKLQAVSSLG